MNNLNKIILGFFVSMSLSEVYASCRPDIVKEIINQRPSKVSQKNYFIEQHVFSRIYDKLNQTLSGNLATVFRSEWKAKNSFEAGLSYLDKIIKKYHGKNLLSLERNGVSQIEYVRRELSKNQDPSSLKIRDLPGPEGSVDRTFTYYTKSLLGREGGKHQVRLRTYVRSLEVNAIKSGQMIKGFFENGPFSIKRQSVDSFLFEVEGQQYIFTKAELISKLGETIFYYPAHGKNLKLEIKTRLPEIMESTSFPKLEGDNYVQKLSVGLTFDQAKRLFGSIGETKSQKLMTIEEVKNELQEKAPHQTLRSEAIFDVLKEGLQHDNGFMEFSGATEYGRLALEVKIGEKDESGEPIWVQTTMDFDMKVRAVYQNRLLLSPREVVKLNKKEQTMIVDRNSEKLHIELKVPKYLVEKILKDPLSVSTELKELLELYHELNVVNRGKFNYIIQEGN